MLVVRDPRVPERPEEDGVHVVAQVRQALIRQRLPGRQVVVRPEGEVVPAQLEPRGVRGPVDGGDRGFHDVRPDTVAADRRNRANATHARRETRTGHRPRRTSTRVPCRRRSGGTPPP